MSSFTPLETALLSWAPPFICAQSPPAKHTITPKANTFQPGYQQMKQQTLMAWMRLLLEKGPPDRTPKEWKLSRQQGWRDAVCTLQFHCVHYLLHGQLTSCSCFFMKWSICCQLRNIFISIFFKFKSSYVIAKTAVQEPPRQEASVLRLQCWAVSVGFVCACPSREEMQGEAWPAKMLLQGMSVDATSPACRCLKAGGVAQWNTETEQSWTWAALVRVRQTFGICRTW